jgi:cytochrome c oxidase subunit 2
VNRLDIQADAPGTYRGQCAEFCGQQHTLMALHVVAMPQPDWERWFAQRRAEVAAPVTQVALRGRQVFADAGCVACHAVRGLSAPPPGLGPDLSDMGSRPSIGAGLLPNNRGNLVAWISAAQSLKPGNRMPSFHHLDGASLDALAVYLSGLQ